jgi:hypothetical protein
MPRFWLSGPRLFNGLVRPGISFSGRELAAWHKKAPKVAENATLGVCRRPDWAMMLAIPGKNGEAEREPELAPLAAFFSRSGTAPCGVWAAVWVPMVGFQINHLDKLRVPSGPRPRRLESKCHGHG